MNKIKFCVSEYNCKIDSHDNEIGGIDEYQYWYDTLDEAIAAKPRFINTMESELASHMWCARKREKGHVCVEAWIVDEDDEDKDLIEMIEQAWEHLSDEEKEKLNLANEITDIWGRDL